MWEEERGNLPYETLYTELSLDRGIYDALSAIDLSRADATATITVNCTPNIDFNIDIDRVRGLQLLLICLMPLGSLDSTPPTLSVSPFTSVMTLRTSSQVTTTITRAMVQTGGAALRVAARTIEDEFLHSPAVMRLLLHYTMALSTQMAQTVVCSRHHTLEQRLCRRLLQGLRRQYGSELVMTQEQLGLLLGVRRESITTEAFKLQKAGVVRYSRGHILVLDREGLEERACECRRVVEREYERLLPLPPSSRFHLLPSVQTAESSGRTMARSGRASMVRPSQRVTS